MFLTDYKIKILNFLAGSFRRLAEVLSVEPEMTKTADSDETDSAPPADWLERTRHISPEQWFDFSEENNEAVEENNKAEITSPPEISPTVEKEKETEVTQVKPAKNPRIEKSAEIISDAAFIPKEEKPKRFLSFKKSDKNSEKNQPKRESRPIENPLEIVRQPPTEAEKFSPVPIKKTKFLSFSTVPVRKSESADAAPPVETRLKKSTAAMQTSTVSEKVKSDAQTGKIISRENDDLAVKKNRIVTESRSRNRFLTEEFSPIDSNEQTEIKRNNFENPKAALSENFIFPAKKNEPPEEYSYFTIKKTNAKTFVENPKVKYKEDKEEIADSNVFTVPPWIDLPESFFSGEFKEIETIRAEAEHLLYLKHEQEG